jgi:hypothetical protein
MSRHRGSLCRDVILIEKVGAGGVTQVSECLPSKLVFLSSNSSTTKKKKNCFNRKKELELVGL